MLSDKEYDDFLVKFVMESKYRFAKDLAMWKSKPSGIRVKFVDRGDQILIKVYEGYHTLQPAYGKAQRGGGEP